MDGEDIGATKDALKALLDSMATDIQTLSARTSPKKKKDSRDGDQARRRRTPRRRRERAQHQGGPGANSADAASKDGSSSPQRVQFASEAQVEAPAPTQATSTAIPAAASTSASSSSAEALEFDDTEGAALRAMAAMLAAEAEKCSADLAGVVQNLEGLHGNAESQAAHSIPAPSRSAAAPGSTAAAASLLLSDPAGGQASPGPTAGSAPGEGALQTGHPEPPREVGLDAVAPSSPFSSSSSSSSALSSVVADGRLEASRQPVAGGPGTSRARVPRRRRPRPAAAGHAPAEVSVHAPGAGPSARRTVNPSTTAAAAAAAASASASATAREEILQRAIDRLAASAIELRKALEGADENSTGRVPIRGLKSALQGLNFVLRPGELAAFAKRFPCPSGQGTAVAYPALCDALDERFGASSSSSSSAYSGTSSMGITAKEARDARFRESAARNADAVAKLQRDAAQRIALAKRLRRKEEAERRALQEKEEEEARGRAAQMRAIANRSRKAAASRARERVEEERAREHERVRAEMEELEKHAKQAEAAALHGPEMAAVRLQERRRRQAAQEALSPQKQDGADGREMPEASMAAGGRARPGASWAVVEPNSGEPGEEPTSPGYAARMVALRRENAARRRALAEGARAVEEEERRQKEEKLSDYMNRRRVAEAVAKPRRKAAQRKGPGGRGAPEKIIPGSLAAPSVLPHAAAKAKDQAPSPRRMRSERKLSGGRVRPGERRDGGDARGHMQVDQPYETVVAARVPRNGFAKADSSVPVVFRVAAEPLVDVPHVHVSPRREQGDEELPLASAHYARLPREQAEDLAAISATHHAGSGDSFGSLVPSRSVAPVAPVAPVVPVAPVASVGVRSTVRVQRVRTHQVVPQAQVKASTRIRQVAVPTSTGRPQSETNGAKKPSWQRPPVPLRPRSHYLRERGVNVLDQDDMHGQLQQQPRVGAVRERNVARHAAHAWD